MLLSCICFSLTWCLWNFWLLTVVSLTARISLLFCKVIMWLWPVVLSLYLVILYINKSLISCYLLILLSSASDPPLHSRNAWNISLLCWGIPLSLLQLWHLNFSDCQDLRWSVYWNFFVWPDSSIWWIYRGWHMQRKMHVAVLLGLLKQCQVSCWNGKVFSWNPGLWVKINDF